MTRARVLSWLYVSVIGFFLFSPVLLVVVFSFNSGQLAAPPFEGFSLRWYEQVFQDPVMVKAIRNSAVVAVGTCAFVLVAGTSAAFALTKRRSKLLDAVSAVVMLPLMLPGLFIGVALLSFFSRLNVELSVLTIIIGHAIVTLPFVVLVVNARLMRIDRSIIEAARDLGAGGMATFRRIVLPLIYPALLGAAMLALAWSADEFIITLFTNGGDTTVPVQIFAMTRRTVDPSINALASLVLATTVLASLIASRFISVKDIAQ